MEQAKSSHSLQCESLLLPDRLVNTNRYDYDDFMKALSVVAPAGSLISQGIKTLEIRRWIPDLTTGEDLLIVENNQFLMREGDEDIGVAVAIVRL
ncbi:ASCH domain-containing protein [Salmonella enterica]|nr:ASCH domain-containing protein [Salmonella enterica]